MKTLLCCCLVLTLLCMSAAARGQEKPYQPPKDYKDFDLKVLGLVWVKEAKDPKTGFVVGGKNPTERIRGLTEINDQKVERLEKLMRPGGLSTAGFLGPDEKLLDVMAADNEHVVDKLGLTHQELARHLRLLGAVGRWAYRADFGAKPHEFTYHGRRMSARATVYRGYQESPFHDGTRTDTDVTLTNLDTGKKLEYSLLVPDMIERYGFYEGKGTKYRVEPSAALAVLDFIKPKKAK